MTALERFDFYTEWGEPRTPELRSDGEWVRYEVAAKQIEQLSLDLAQHKGNASEVIRLQGILRAVASCGQLEACSVCRDSLMEFGQ